MKRRQDPLKNQKGFTLVEIIAVLILLGILAAVAIPRYIGLTDQARENAALAAISEAKGRLSTAYGAVLLDGGGTAPGITAVVTSAGFTDATQIVVGDYALTPTIAGNSVGIVVDSVQGNALSPTTAGTWDLPE